MALVVTHNSTADGDPLIDGDDWNANHTLTGGGTFRIPQLIETKTLGAGTTTTTFSSLNGDKDGEYYLEWDITLVSGGADRSIYLYPNNTTTNQKEVENYSTDSAEGYAVNSFIRIASTSFSQDFYCFGSANIFAPTGKVRRVKTYKHSVATNVARYMVLLGTGYWNETATNITSLVLTASGGSFSGTVKLYKMVDLAI